MNYQRFVVDGAVIVGWHLADKRHHQLAPHGESPTHRLDHYRRVLDDSNATSHRFSRSDEEKRAFVDLGPDPGMEGPVGPQAGRPALNDAHPVARIDRRPDLLDEAGRRPAGKSQVGQIEDIKPGAVSHTTTPSDRDDRAARHGRDTRRCSDPWPPSRAHLLARRAGPL